MFVHIFVDKSPKQKKTTTTMTQKKKTVSIKCHEHIQNYKCILNLPRVGIRRLHNKALAYFNF